MDEHVTLHINSQVNNYGYVLILHAIPITLHWNNKGGYAKNPSNFYTNNTATTLRNAKVFAEKVQVIFK